MQTVTFIILPSTDAKELESKILLINDLCNRITGNSDNVLVASDFYDPDKCGITILEAINNMHNGSEKKLLMQTIAKIKMSDKGIEDINLSDYHNQLIGISDAHHDFEDYIIRSTDELLKYYQTSAYCLMDFSELFDWKKRCFPELLFSEDSFGSNNKAFGNCAESVFKKLYFQTIDCLRILNNNRTELLVLNNNERIKFLQSKLDKIECTGKGSNEDKDFKKKVYRISDKNGEKSRIECDIVCTTHFKLIRRDSDYRIYFSWENANLQHLSFIIVKVGGHWNERTDSSLSRIVNI